jgi:hypothetical protein
MAWFYCVFCETPPWSYLAGLAALGACWLIASQLEPLWLGALTSAVLVAVATWETLRPGPEDLPTS